MCWLHEEVGERASTYAFRYLTHPDQIEKLLSCTLCPQAVKKLSETEKKKMFEILGLDNLAPSEVSAGQGRKQQRHASTRMHADTSTQSTCLHTTLEQAGKTLRCFTPPCRFDQDSSCACALQWHSAVPVHACLSPARVNCMCQFFGSWFDAHQHACPCAHRRR